MPKTEGVSPRKLIQMSTIPNKKATNVVKGLFINQSPIQQTPTTNSKEKYINKQQNLLLINFNESDIMLSYTEIVDQSLETKFRLRYYILQIIISYGIIIGINYLSGLYYLPYFLMVTIYAFFHFLSPYKFEHLIIFMAYGFLIGNSILGIQFLSYPTILIIYLSVASFQRSFYQNILPIVITILLAAYGYLVLPNLYTLLSGFQYGNYIFIYLFPVLDLIMELIIDILVLLVNKPKVLYYSFYLFLLGIQFGIAMSVSILSAEFWYLCIFVTLKVVNSQSQFFIGFAKRRLIKFACLNLTVQQKTISYKNGYILKLTLPTIGIIFLYSYLNFNSPPFSTITATMMNLYQVSWIQPTIYGGTIFLYELISLKVNSRIGQKRKILMEYEKGNLIRAIQYGIVYVFGYWIFYIGYEFQSMIIKYH